MTRTRRTTVLASVLGALAALGARTAAAAPCADLVTANPGARIIYVENGDTQEPLLKLLGRQLRDNANIVLAYVNTGSCTLTPNMYNGTPIAVNTNMSYVPSTAESATWTPATPSPTCTTDATTPQPIDLAISALFPASCKLGAPDAGTGVGLINGPIQAYTFIAPTGSGQKAIWAEEAHYAFGFGNANLLTPWNNISYLFIRPPTKSTLVATAFNILVDPGKWKGTPEPASTDVFDHVKGSGSVDATLGILGSEVYDAKRGQGVKVLAYRAFGQKHAYFPDSTDQSFDKANLRDGHYTLWSPTVYLTAVDATNTPTNPVVKYVVDLVLGHEGAAAPDGGTAIDGLGTVVSAGLTPDCAMRVSRSTDGGPLAPYTPLAGCGCYFASKVPGAAAGAPPGCKTCTADADCAPGKCHHNFCEAQ